MEMMMMLPSLGTSLQSARGYFCLNRVSRLCLLGEMIIVSRVC
ncbi:hypothetical protein LINGRAHAP2_LOCUS28167 [Linum grandiflorum]